MRSDLTQQFKIENGLELIDFTVSQRHASLAYSFRGNDYCLVPQKVVNYDQRRFILKIEIGSLEAGISYHKRTYMSKR